MYNEEQQERGVELMKARGLTMGRLVHPIKDGMVANAVVSVVNSQSPFWYGDLDFPTDLSALKSIARELKDNIMVTTEHYKEIVILTTE